MNLGYFRSPEKIASFEMQTREVKDFESMLLKVEDKLQINKIKEEHARLFFMALNGLFGDWLHPDALMAPEKDPSANFLFFSPKKDDTTQTTFMIDEIDIQPTLMNKFEFKITDELKCRALVADMQMAVANRKHYLSTNLRRQRLCDAEAKLSKFHNPDVCKQSTKMMLKKRNNNQSGDESVYERLYQDSQKLERKR